MTNQDATMSKTFGFIITKPLQLMVVMAIIEQLPDEIRKELLIVDAFFDAEKISKKLTTSNPKWRSSFFMKDYPSAFEFCRKKKYESVFLDSDVGFLRNIDLIRLRISSPKTHIAVYEEGLGSYRNDLYHGVKKKILSILGVGVYFGGNWLTNEIYLFKPDEYNKNIREINKKFVKINKKISQLVKNQKNYFCEIFDIEELRYELNKFSKNNYCDIYLTNWIYDKAILKSIPKIDSCRILKLHPHIKEIPNDASNEFDILASPKIPAEILISIAASIFKKVRVFHHGSSVVRYLEIENVEFTSHLN